MCFGIPGQIVSATADSDLARVDMFGVVREVNVGLLEGPLEPGDYILIHSGFALERMTVEQVRDALAAFAAADEGRVPAAETTGPEVPGRFLGTHGGPR